MLTIFERLMMIVTSLERRGRGTPLRIKLPANLFREYQADFRQRAAEVGIEAIYPGAVLGVPVVESADSHAVITLADGTESPLDIQPATE